MLLFFTLWPNSILAGQLIYASVKRPFPTIMPLDYNLCRAQAWLAALNKAILQMPRQLVPENENLIPGAAAILYPVDTISPEIALDDEIKVFLKNKTQVNNLQDIDQIIVQALFILEIQKLVEQLVQIWPQNLRDADDKITVLENLSQALNKLWSARENHLNSGYVPEDLVAADADSIVLKMFQIEDMLSRKLPQKAIELGENIEKLAESKMSQSDLWQYAAANANFMRARAHEMLNQLSLAESAYSAAIEILEKYYPQTRLLQDAFLARASLREYSHDLQGMCLDYSNACAAGNCLRLSLSRASGICN